MWISPPLRREWSPSNTSGRNEVVRARNDFVERMRGRKPRTVRTGYRNTRDSRRCEEATMTALAEHDSGTAGRILAQRAS